MKVTTQTFRWLELPGSEDRTTPEESEGTGFLSLYRRMASVLAPTVNFDLDGEAEQDEAQRLAA